MPAHSALLRCGGTGLALLTGAAALAALPLQPAAAQSVVGPYHRKVVASNLLNPRGLTADPSGRVLVSEGGSGGADCSVPGAPPSPPTALRCWGNTGAIGRFDPSGGSYSRLWSGLDSIARGPGALSPVAGLQDLSFTSDGRLLGVYGFRGDPATRPVGTLFAQLVRFNYASPGSTPVPLADLGAFETANPSHTPPFSNPFALAWHGGNSYVTEAGANRLLKIDDVTNTVQLLENFPAVASTTPPAEAVPTGLAINPSGTIYNTQLPGYPFQPGTASIFRSDGTPGSATAIAGGFTNAMDMALGADGWLYLVQWAEDFSNPVGTGSLWRYNPTSGVRQLLDSGLDQPTGVLAMADGSVYVATGGSTTSGALVQYRPVPGPLPLAGGVVAWRLARTLRRRVRAVR
ncbi:MAG: ScyD/ScyE family protein [Synechococcaceae cyanobacterium]|nr:ScyD/ScyE family protein [Synechococcaceae cyanobacterium]